MRIWIRTIIFKVLAVTFCSILPFFAKTQTNRLRFEPAEMPDGKPIASIGAYCEDSRGFMWFGGYTGLFRYDGNKVIQFVNNPEDSLSICDSKVNVIEEDRSGNIWVATQNGLNVYDPRKRIFKRYINEKKCGLGPWGAGQIKQDDNGVIWVNSNGYIFKFDSVEQRFHRVFPYTEKLDTLSAGIAICNRRIYNGTNKGVFVCNIDGGNFQLIPFADTKMDQNKVTSYIILKDKHNKIWASTYNGLHYVDTTTNTLRRVESLDKKLFITELFIKNENELWIGTPNNGLYEFNTNNFKYKIYSNDSTDSQSIPKYAVTNGFYSSQEILWLDLDSYQLHRMDMIKQKFQNIQMNLYIPSLYDIFQIYEYSPNVLLMPFKEGPSLYDFTTRKRTIFPYVPNYNTEGWKKGGMACFFEELNGKLWIGTSSGLFLFDKKAKRFINIENQIKEIAKLNKAPIRSVLKDKKGNIWVLTWHTGCFKFNLEKKIFRTYYNGKETLQSNSLSAARSIIEDKKGNIWIGTRGGLLRYMESGDTFKVYKNILNDPESISENTGFCLYEGENENIWVGTYGGGLNKLDVKTGKFKHFTTKNGLLNNNVNSIFPDKKGNLWLGTFDGISVFNLEKETFRNIQTQQGILNQELSSFNYGRGTYSDYIFWGGNKGIDFFDPNRIEISKFDPKINLTDFKLFNKSVSVSRGEKNTKEFLLNEDIGFTKHLTLTYDQNVIGFEFAALDFSAPKSIQYSYILENFDKDWQYIGNNRTATFTNLNPGDYIFKVKATNGDGVWGTKTASVTITVLAPWWQTWWFRSLVVLTISGLVFAFYKYRVNQIKEKEAIKTSLNKRIAEVKMEALRAQMNPHFIFNALTSINLFILKNDTETASFYLNKFSRLMREVLDHSRSDVITVEEEINTLKVYIDIEKMRFRDAFIFILDVQPTARIGEIQIPPLIIQPYVENAIWHGLKHKKEGEAILRINVYEDSEYFYIKVEDTGVGRAKAMDLKKYNSEQTHKSHGLNITEERIRQYVNTHSIETHIETIDLMSEQHQPLGTQIIFKIKHYESNFN